MSPSTSTNEEGDWIKLDLHIHTLDDPKDKLDYSAHELLARARRLGFSVLAITLHDAVFDRPEVFAAAQRLGILLISAAEMRIEGADIILLNVTGRMWRDCALSMMSGNCVRGVPKRFLPSRRILFICSAVQLGHVCWIKSIASTRLSFVIFTKAFSIPIGER
jgi:hypothetical protein